VTGNRTAALRCHQAGKVAFVCGALLACLLLPGPARGDGGRLQLSETSGNYRITVFTAPNPCRAGPVDVSVLVQDAVTGAVLPDATVVVTATDQVTPARPIEQPATGEAATNKLFHAAILDLPNPGLWEMTIRIDGPRGQAVSRFEVEVADPIPPWVSLWPWLTWPAVVIAVFGVHQWRASGGGPGIPHEKWTRG
jgi:hypothetical protein